MPSLTQVPEGARARIVDVEGSERFLARVTSIGLTVGCELEVMQNVRKRPVLVYCRDSAVAVDRGDCESIIVEVMA